jgi:DNA-binding transcriptional LysR family regulator
MSLQRFEHFLAIADEANFGRAAARIGIKQPPLSQSIRRLERDLGVALFERTGKGATLTEAGRAFLPEARAAVAAARRATALARAAVGTRLPLRLGVISVALWESLPALLEVADRAGVRVEMRQATTNEQLQLLARGELDLGFVAPPFDAPPRLIAMSVASEPVVAAVPEALAQGGAAVTLETIADRLVMFPRAEGPVLYDAILAMFRTRGLVPEIIQESPRMLTTLALVAANRGVALVPAALARSVAVKGVAFCPLKSVKDVPAWPLSLAHMPLAAQSDTAKLVAEWRRGAAGHRPPAR